MISHNAAIASFLSSNDPFLMLVGILFQEIKNSSTFDKFKTYIQLNIPQLFEFVNSMGEYHDNNNANE